MDPLAPMFEPRSVVVIGASQDKSKLGYGVARNLIGSGYPGEIYLVNPRGGELFGKPIIPSIDLLEKEIDLALVVVRAELVPNILIACSQIGIKHFIILTSGFKESGDEGKAIEYASKKIADEYRLRILGPNCVGIIDTHLPIDTTFIQPPMPLKGNIAFVTQSGALSAALIDYARGEGLGFSKLISLGNQMDVDESDILYTLADDSTTKAIVMYLETIQNGNKFLEIADNASAKKPIIALKVGRSNSGQQAAISHTGSLAGTDAAFTAAFRRANILRASNTREMFNWAIALAELPEPRDNRVAILTNAGGPGVIAADSVEHHGLRMAVLSTETQKKLSQFLSEAASINNPVDMLASASPETYRKCLRILIEDPNVDMICVIAPPPPLFSASAIADQVIETIKAAQKPVLVSLMGSSLVQDAKINLNLGRVPNFPYPEDCINAFSAVWKNKVIRMQNQSLESYSVPQNDIESLRTLISNYKYDDGVLPYEVIEKIFMSYKLPIQPMRLAPNEELAVQRAKEIEYQVAMKISIFGMSHKSDIGGVILDLGSENEVRSAYRYLELRANEFGKIQEFQGVYLQKMATPGHECIVGATRDAVFGPLLMFGSGGIEVEGKRDIEFALAPITKSDLDFIVQNTWAGKRLNGYRNHPKGDIESVKGVLIKVSQMMSDLPEIKEIEMNPLIVGEDHSGSSAVDVRIVIDVPREKE